MPTRKRGRETRRTDCGEENSCRRPDNLKMYCEENDDYGGEDETIGAVNAVHDMETE